MAALNPPSTPLVVRINVESDAFTDLAWIEGRIAQWAKADIKFDMNMELKSESLKSVSPKKKIGAVKRIGMKK